MSVRRGEHVLILTDRGTLEIGEALSNAAEQASKEEVKLFVLEDYGQRPAKELPKRFLNHFHGLTLPIMRRKADRENLRSEDHSYGPR